MLLLCNGEFNQLFSGLKILNIEYTTLAQSLKHLMTEQWNSVVNISKQESGGNTITSHIPYYLHFSIT